MTFIFRYALIRRIHKTVVHHKKRKNNRMKKKQLNSSQLGLMSSALMKNLFPKPFSGELLVDDSPNDGSCVLYFRNEYHEKLDTKIREKYYEGAFARSNAESEWIDFMSAINTAEETNDDTSTFTKYWLSVEPEKESKPKVEVNLNKLSEIINSERPVKKGWIGDVMEDIFSDLSSVYVGHSIGHNFNGYITIEKIIDTKSMFATKINMLPMLKILEKYKVEIDSFEIMRLFNPEKINATIYLKK